MMELAIYLGIAVVGILLLVVFVKEVIGVQFISNDRVGIVEKLWGTSIPEGQIIALNGEAGMQCEMRRGGIHFGYPRWKYKIHRVPLVTIPQGKIGYLFARDGQPLGPDQTLGRAVDCNNFQDARAFLTGSEGHQPGQRGRQRLILREGVYAINVALFIVITENVVYCLDRSREEMMQMAAWQQQLAQVDAFNPVVIGFRADVDNNSHDLLGIVAVQDGPPLASGEIIAPEVPNHNNFQNPDAFLAAGGRRGRQYAVLTDGTYFINRWFATVEQINKTIVPIGYVGVVISYVGKKGTDISGSKFRHGERVAQGERGVWADALGPGKYAFNTYAGQVVLVPTTNFVLHWITGRSESHKYDEGLRSIDLVTRDAYEPVLPLSLVVHIDYQKAPQVIQRFGDVKKLITQTIDPMLSAFFRDVSHKRSFLELLQNRDEIQREARDAMKVRFEMFDIELIDVLIGKPDAGDNDNGKIETLLEQLRQRQLSKEQVETFEQRKIAAEKRKTLEEATAVADRQKDLTNSSVEIQIVENRASAELAKAQMEAKQRIVLADAMREQSRREAETQIIRAEAAAKQTVMEAKAKSEQEILLGKGQGTKALQVGLAEAESMRRMVAAYGDPRLYSLVKAASAISQSAQPLVPERVFVTGGGDGAKSPNVLDTLLTMILAQNTTFANGTPPIDELTKKLLSEAETQLGIGDARGELKSDVKTTNGAEPVSGRT